MECTPTKESEIKVEFNVLSDSISRYDGLACELKNRLNPVMKPEPKTDIIGKEGKIPEIQSPLVNEIREKIIRINNTNKMLSDILNLLQI